MKLVLLFLLFVTAGCGCDEDVCPGKFLNVELIGYDSVEVVPARVVGTRAGSLEPIDTGLMHSALWYRDYEGVKRTRILFKPGPGLDFHILTRSDSIVMRDVKLSPQTCGVCGKRKDRVTRYWFTACTVGDSLIVGSPIRIRKQ